MKKELKDGNSVQFGLYEAGPFKALPSTLTKTYASMCISQLLSIVICVASYVCTYITICDPA